MFFAHGLTGFFVVVVNFLQFLVPELSHPFGQFPHTALPFTFAHLRALVQPPLFFAHGLTGFFVGASVVVNFSGNTRMSRSPQDVPHPNAFALFDRMEKVCVPLLSLPVQCNFTSSHLLLLV